MKKYFFLILYYGIFRYFPASDFPVFGSLSMKLRYICVKHIFKRCGKNVNIERMAFFGKGNNIEIGDNSGIGINCIVPPSIVIGENVMMGPNCCFFAHNHRFDRVDIPMIEQGFYSSKHVTIEDDVWIGRGVMVMPGRTIRKGSIIGAGCILTKDFPPYSIVGGNPGKLIRSRS